MKVKRYSVRLVEGKEKSYLLATVLILSHIETMTTLDPGNAEFSFIQHFALTPPRDDVDTVLKRIHSEKATNDNFDLYISYDPFLCEIIEALE